MNSHVSESHIEAMIDYAAQRAALRVHGLASVAGVGTGLYPDPLRLGQTIAAALSNPIEAWAHWTELPTAPAVQYVNQEGGVELTWTIPQRLFLPKAPLEEIRAALIPFYSRYLSAFVPDPRLGGLALRSQIAGFSIGNDSNWSWLAIPLLVVERVSYQ